MHQQLLSCSVSFDCVCADAADVDGSSGVVGGRGGKGHSLARVWWQGVSLRQV